ncbi:MAG: ankyrin repeat domain-containing protein [Gammaproteobacteria bacterium]
MRPLILCIATLGTAACGAPDTPVANSPSDFRSGNADQTAMRIELHFSGGLRELAQAAANGDARRVAELVDSQRLDPNALSDEGMPLLLWPLHQRNLDGFEALLESGADPNRRAGNGEILMHYVVEAGLPDFARAALRHQAKPNDSNRDQESLVHIARRTQNWDVLAALLDFGADVDAFEGGLHGNTVLSMATGFGDFEHAHWLLERGADPTYALKQAPRPERVGAMPMLEDIFHRPVDADAFPEAADWQRRCQKVLLARGIEPPAKPDRYR